MYTTLLLLSEPVNLVYFYMHQYIASLANHHSLRVIVSCHSRCVGNCLLHTNFCGIKALKGQIFESVGNIYAILKGDFKPILLTLFISRINSSSNIKLNILAGRDGCFIIILASK